MASARRDAALRQIDRLFGEGTLAGLPDARLLERYTTHRDELAFEALVRRHGPMVLGVCRRLLDDPNDADDAFQAAFLLLARKARSIWVEGSLGGWLHRVAWRIALQLKSDAARRRDQERRAAERAGEPVTYGPGRDDTLAVIHQEIDRLPDRYRRPVVLCFLEEMTYQQAADQLRWSEATTRGRLARARDLLRTRLIRRGVTLAGTGLTLAAGASPSTAAAVPAALLQCTVRAARQIVLGESAAAVSTTTIVLMKQAARSMMIARFKAMAAAALLVATMTGLATGLAATGIGGDDQRPAGSRPAMKGGPTLAVTAAPTRTTKGEMMSCRGRVLRPDGQPAANAEVVVVVSLPRALTSSVETSRVLAQARTDPEGRFLLELPREVVDNACWVDTVAYLPGYAAGFRGPIPYDRREAVIRLEPEEPVRIRLLDLEGRPASGARLWVVYLQTAKKLQFDGMIRVTAPDRPLPGWLGTMIADDEGRLTIPGLARDTVVQLEVLDDRFAVQRFRIRAGQAVANGAVPPTFTLTPAHWIEGRVRLGESGAVAAGAPFLVISHVKQGDDPQDIRTGGRTDANGRFRVNVPRCEDHEILVYPPDSSPFAFRRVFLAATQGLRQEIDVVLPRGVLVRGKVVESPSGRAVAGAILEYRPRQAGNPNFQKEAVAGRGGYQPTAVSGPDGSFRLGVLPGPGHLLIKAPAPAYIAVETSKGELETGAPGGPRLYPDGLLAVDAPAGAKVEATITLRRGATVRGRVVGPDGRPAGDAGFFTRSANNDGFETDLSLRPVANGEFELTGLDPDKPTTVFFLDTRNQLARIVTFSGRDLDRPVTVPLERCGSARARFVDAEGQPFANVQFSVSRQPMIELEMIADDRSPAPRDAGPKPEIEKTLFVNLDHERYQALTSDNEGRVTYPTLIPGATYRILAGEGAWVTKKEFVAVGGRTLDLGDITINPGP